MIGATDEVLLPARLDLRGRLVVVLGGGPEAEEYVRLFTRYGADLLVVAPDITDELDALVAQGHIEHEERSYVRGDLSGAFIAVCTEDCLEVARAVYQEGEGMGCLVHVVGQPALSTVELGATLAAGRA